MPSSLRQPTPAPTPAVLQPVGPDDVAELLTLAREFHLEDGHPLDAGGERAIRQTCAGHPMVRGYLVREGPATLGYCVITLGFGIEFGGPDIFLDDLYLVPDARGRGVGDAVMAAIGAEALRHKARAIHLVVAPGNERAQRLYLRSGFARADYVLMSKRL
jgi:ribosomal protein S18 acetylase RimI-like enzyme